MELAFLHNTKINFIAKRYLFFAISGAVMLAGIVSLVLRGGPNYGIDFSGGVLLQMGFSAPVAIEDVRSALNAGGIQGMELQSSFSKGQSSVIIRVKKADMDPDQLAARVKELLQQKFPQTQMTMERTEFVGPAVGSNLSKQALLALIFSFLGIIVYVAFRFHSGIWGASGVIGIMHDVFVVFGIFSILNREITLTVVAAFLTIAGYSINDTIVIFDRIRENLRLSVKEDFGAVINRSVNQCMSRTIITSTTVFLAVLALYFLGGDVIHDFALAMLIGTIVGVYSTVFICSPLVYEWEMYKRRRMSEQFKGAAQKRLAR